MSAFLQRHYQARKAAREDRLLAHELEFLPAADALRETPLHPAPRLLLYLILLTAALVLLWAFLGRVDVISVAPGTVLANGRSKVIQSEITATVKTIHVAEGTPVRAGQRLLDLDPSLTEADLAKLANQRRAARMDQAYSEAMLAAIDNDIRTVATASLDMEAAEREGFQARLDAGLEELRARLQQSDSKLAQQQADATALRSSIALVRETLPISEEQAADYRRLLEGKFVAKHAWLERERLVLQQRRELAIQRANLSRAEAAERETGQQRAHVVAQARQSLLELQLESSRRIALLDEEIKKARRSNGLMHLTSPVDGVVQDLAVSAPGAVVTSAQPVLRVVPSGVPMEVEALVQNRDVGFIRVGQVARIKVDSYDFTRFGMLSGRIHSISRDVVPDTREGATYRVRIRLAPLAPGAALSPMPLSPGMTVRAEITTGRRRVIDYFLSPLESRLSESLRER
ncbi:MAG TPA: HlyD family type I secretion periplasmic adaptor subunit [Stenotrophomonas sp.]|jgi:hemolysin D